MALRGGYAGDGPPPPMPMMGPPPPGPLPPPPPGYFPLYESYSAIRNYEALELALHRADPVWRYAYERAAMQSDSEAGMGSEYHYYHQGDTIIASEAHAKVDIGGGVSIIGTLHDTDMSSDRTRRPAGNISVNAHTNLLTGKGGIALEAWGDTAVMLTAMEGNSVTGARLKAYSGDANSFLLTDIVYHQPYLDTPTAIWSRADKDGVVLATGRHLGYGLWASLSGAYDNYGVHGDASVAQTAGWKGNLRWATGMGGILTGISYDGHGEYLLAHDNFTGDAPSPLSRFRCATWKPMPSPPRSPALSGRTCCGWISMAATSPTAICERWRPVWRRAALHARAGRGSCVRGAAHHRLRYPGRVGAETSAGLSFTLGFGGAPRSQHIFY